MVPSTIEVSRKGKWVPVPSCEVCGHTVIVEGRGLRIASVHDEHWLEKGIADPGVIVAELTGENDGGLNADLFTFAQRIPSGEPQFGYYQEWDSIAVLRSDNFQRWWQGLRQETRKNVRRAAKRGVIVRHVEFGDDLIAGISGVNDDSPLRQGLPNVHYGKSLKEVKRDELSFLDRSEFLAAYLGDDMIGFAKIVYCGKVGVILNFVVKPSHADCRPANALVAKLVQACETRGMTYLTYGMFNYGNKRYSSLRQFKIYNGFEEFRVPRYFIPLSLRGHWALRLGLHRGLVGMLPERAITLAGRLREHWYVLKQAVPFAQDRQA